MNRVVLHVGFGIKLDGTTKEPRYWGVPGQICFAHVMGRSRSNNTIFDFDDVAEGL